MHFFKKLAAVLFISLTFLYFIILNLTEEQAKKPPDEIENILKSTSYLWRPDFGQKTKYPVNPSRLAEQRKWTREISKTKIFKFLKPKTIFVEFPYTFNLSDLDPQNICGKSLPAYENKCNLIFAQTEETERELLDLLASGVEIDVVITVRNSKKGRPNYKLPRGIPEIVFMAEPPAHTVGEDLSVNQDFLATYDLYNSDFPAPYYEYEECEREDSVEVQQPIDVKKKTKLALALISNCWSKLRLDIVEELQKYMEIDVFGGCGKELPNCYRNMSLLSCTKDITTEYKFFLAFENSNCRHYITEKLFRNALLYGMVPVVIGAHPADYELAAPKNSYILAENFTSLEELANYLKKVDRDEDLYRKYLEWRSKGRITTRAWDDLFCRACSMQFYSSFVPPPSWPIWRHIMWKDINYCLPNNKWRWL